MKKNIGTIDKVIRILIAVVIIGLYAANMIPGLLAIILLILSGVFIITSIFGICPLYMIFKLSSTKKK